MLITLWIAGLLRRRRGRIGATAVGVAIAVAVLASIGTFLSATTAQMTTRAIARVPVDWQVEGQNGIPPRELLAKVAAQSEVRRALPVSFAHTSGLSVNSGGSTRQTGPGRVLGLPDRYAGTFPGELRLLAGRMDGVLLAQQTAANLHAGPGDTVRIGLGGGHAAPVRVDGVVDLPAADSLFQQVGALPGAQAKAPPDNVILLPQRLFDRVQRGHPVSTQIHALISHRLPSSPSAAYTRVAGAGRNLETRLAGQGLVGNNIATVLDGARKDAAYAELLFLFLGLPGAIIAALVTVTIAATGAERRRRDAALLRTRGATTRQLMHAALAESLLAGALGIALGLAAAELIGHGAFGTGSFGASTGAAILWAGGAAMAGLITAGAAIAMPAWRDARSLTVAGQRLQIGRRTRAPLWSRYGLDFVALAGSGAVFWQASKDGYSLVLAPEGVPQVAVNWYALLAPVLAWVGIGLLTYRLAELVLRRGRPLLSGALRPVAGELAPTVSGTMSRQRRRLAGAVALVALTAAFAGSTAIFNATYQQQAEVDARLSNGADVTVNPAPGFDARPSHVARIASVYGVRSVEPLQHRFAYVGADLQDLYGIRPATIGRAGALQDSWFQGGTASALMDRLARHPDSILVSAETVKDFQLRPGDLVRLRLQDARTKRLTTVPFHYAGVVKEFPTAPTDSFLVANAAYVAAQTGSDAVGTFLIQTGGTDPTVVSGLIRRTLGTNATVTDIVSRRKVVGSNLTAVELTGLTRVELGFALVLAIAASGLALGLGFQERRRTFAIAAALGARPRQLGGFVWAESLFVTLFGLALGAAAAVTVSLLLVRVLTGVFDPPPDSPAVPWLYLGGTATAAVSAVLIASTLTLRALRRPAIAELRDL